MQCDVAEMRDSLPQSPEACEFPHALAAMARVEPSLHEAEARMWQSLWIVGDAVLKDVPIQPHGVNDGSYEKLDRLSTVAASLGYGRYSRDRLRKLRQVAARFPEGRRLPDYPWTVHFDAKTPENLNAIIEMAEAEGTAVSSEYAQAKRRQIEGQNRTVGADRPEPETQAGQNLIPTPVGTSKNALPPQLGSSQVNDLAPSGGAPGEVFGPLALPPTKQSSLREQLAALTEELRQRDEEIAARHRLAQDVVDFEVARALKHAREQVSPVPVMARAIAEQNDDIIRAEVVDESQQTAGLNQTNAQVCSAEELEQIVGPKTEPWGGLKPEVLDATDKLVNDFDEVVGRYDLSDVEQRQMARYLFQRILRREAFNEGG